MFASLRLERLDAFFLDFLRKFKVSFWEKEVESSGSRVWREREKIRENTKRSKPNLDDLGRITQQSWRNNMSLMEDFEPTKISFLTKSGRGYKDTNFLPTLESIIGNQRINLCLNLITLDYLGWMSINNLNFSKLHKNLKLSPEKKYSSKIDSILNILKDTLKVEINKKNNIASITLFPCGNLGVEETEIYTDLMIPVDKERCPLFCGTQFYGGMNENTFSFYLRRHAVVLKLLSKFYGSYDNLVKREEKELISLLVNGRLVRLSSNDSVDFYLKIVERRRMFYGNSCSLRDFDKQKSSIIQQPLLLFRPRSSKKGFKFMIYYQKSRRKFALKNLETNEIENFNQNSRLSQESIHMTKLSLVNRIIPQFRQPPFLASFNHNKIKMRSPFHKNIKIKFVKIYA